MKGSLTQFFSTVSQVLMDAAWRENRRYDRIAKRHNRSTAYYNIGLNGERAIARRRRQIARGQIKSENGLIS